MCSDKVMDNFIGGNIFSSAVPFAFEYIDFSEWPGERPAGVDG